MKRLYNAVMCACVLLLIGACVPAYAGEPGSSCVDAIPMGKDYSAKVSKGQSIWYSAWTFDLPLTVTFAPAKGESDPAPKVEMDFTCTPGIYEDSILCSLFCPTSSGNGVQFDMPHSPELKSKTLEGGQFVYYLALGKRYRDLLLQMGISYNVEVYVKVTYQSDGVISMAPDDLFTNCVDGAKFMHYGDTVQVVANDKQRHVIVPYVQWQEDTVVYKWTGTSPCTFSVANTCEFDPTDNSDENIIQYEKDIQPGDSVKVLATWIYKWVNNPGYPNEAGMYFAKVYSADPGVLQVKKVPQAPPRSNAIILRFDRTYALNANDTNLYAITRIWDDDTLNTKFTTPTEHVFRMQIANDPDFSDTHVLKEYQFERNSTGHWQGISGTEMKEFWSKTTEQYLYIRFICSEATTITPSRWIVIDCVKNTASNYIQSKDTTFRVKRAATGGTFRLMYAQWKGGDMNVTFTPALTGSNVCQIYVAKDCNIKLQSISSHTPAENELYYDVLDASYNPIIIPESEIAKWGENVDAEGYIYMQFYHTINGVKNIQLQSTAPEETDPEYPKTTIAVECEGTQVVVRVNVDQHIRINDETNAIVDEWDAVTGTPHAIDLPAGKYTLEGETEKIVVNL